MIPAMLKSLLGFILFGLPFLTFAAKKTSSIPIHIYCSHYIVGLRSDLTEFKNFLPLYRAAVEISAKAHSNANQPAMVDGKTSFVSWPHFDQSYGGERYTVHLIDIESVLRRFGFNPQKSLQARRLYIAARLHDVPEDTKITINHLQDWFGADIAKLVKSVTKTNPSDSITDEQAKTLSIQNVLTHEDGPILKLADRIANVEKGIRSGRILPKYIKDFESFKKILYRPGQADAMWEYLEELLQTQKFPREQSYWDLRIAGLDAKRVSQLEGPLYSDKDKRTLKQKLPTFDNIAIRPQHLKISSLHFMQRYAQDFISHKKFSVIETAHALKMGYLSVDDLSPLEVWKDKTGKIWSLDHRRLAAYILSKNVQSIPVVWVSAEKVQADAFKFDPWREGSNIQILLEDNSVVLVR